jgi:ABC-2 type transport system permease protein
MFAIYRKEMRSYFINPIGYIYLGVFLVFSALLCCYTTLISGSYDTAGYFTFLIVSFIVLIPILTMRLFAEERKLRTEQLLLTAPVTLTGMVLGKYLAALTIYVSGVLDDFNSTVVLGLGGFPVNGSIVIPAKYTANPKAGNRAGIIAAFYNKRSFP